MKKRLIACLIGAVCMTIYAAIRFGRTSDFLTAAVGWSIALDIVILFVMHKIDKEDSADSVNTDNKNTAKRKISYHKQFKVAGVTFPCKLDEAIKRQEILKRCSENNIFYLQEYQYDRKPAFLVVCKEQNLDIGSVPADFVSTVLKYKERDTDLKCINIDYFDEGRKRIYFAKMQFIVYKD